LVWALNRSTRLLSFFSLIKLPFPKKQSCMSSVISFFSALDPNFLIKGSRDPLGFQTVWQDAGRGWVKHLSTVSNNLQDFRILLLAHFFFNKYGPRDAQVGFIPFFLKFEQACGYARRFELGEGGFNGIDFVNKQRDNTVFTLSTQQKDQLLSNQKAYGIYGKYNRPLQDMKIVEDAAFAGVMEGLVAKADQQWVEPWICQCIKENEIQLRSNDLSKISALLKALTPKEKEFYTRKILKVKLEPTEMEKPHLQNELYNLVRNTHELLPPEWHLEDVLTAFEKQKLSSPMQRQIKRVRSTNQLIHTYNCLFRTLQTRSSWLRAEIESHPLLGKTIDPIQNSFEDPDLDDLNKSLGLNPFDRVKRIWERNEEVSRARNNSSAWLRIEEAPQRVVVSYRAGAEEFEEIKYEESGNTFFLNTYFRLFQDVNPSA
jgi:hypothetical protein